MTTGLKLRFVLDQDIRYDFRWKYVKPKFEVLGQQRAIISSLELQLWDDLVHEPILADNPGT